MSKTLRRVLLVLVVSMVLVTAGHFALPFGITPKWASPNCGPEHWRLLNSTFPSKSEVVTYLQGHERELLSGTLEPGQDGYSIDWNVAQADVMQFRQSIAEDIVSQDHLGYMIYTFTFHRPACSESQTYTFKVTSYGFASLYGCCGI